MPHSAVLYLATVLIWGSSWFAIKFQLTDVAPELSVAYRFALASLMLAGYCLARSYPLRFSPRDHLFILLQGLMLFCLNYLIFYYATAYLTSGLIAVIFSTLVFMNIFNGRLFFGNPVEAHVVAGACMGVFGILSIFWPELSDLDMSSGSLKGIGMSIAATYLASLGNMAYLRNHKNNLPVVSVNTLGMFYGAVAMFAWVLVSGVPLRYDVTWSYNLSLLYLSVFASVLAFGCFLTLVGRIGPDKAAYTSVAFPIVALTISTFYEDYQWTPAAGFGVVLVVLGNVVVVSKNYRDRLGRADSRNR